MKGKGAVVLVLMGVALTLVAIRTGRGAQLRDAINGRLVVNR